MGKSLSSKYGLLDSAKKSASKIDAIKTASKRAIQKTAEATDDLIGNQIADKTTSVSKKYPKELQNDKIEVGRANPKDLPEKRYISPQQIIDELSLV